MNKAIEKLIDRNRAEHPRFRDQRLREVIQVLVLLGLKRAGFFETASFYGGTALRLLHGLDRFSEDLDFCLNPGFGADFDFKACFPAIEETLAAFGFQMRIEAEEKARPSPIQSAFVKGSTSLNYLAIGESREGMHPGQMTKVKIEIDTENPDGGIRQLAAISEPEPFLVQTLEPDSLFAGKLHAIIAREMAGRVKGRDFYDFLHFISKGTRVNLKYLRAKLIDSAHIRSGDPFDIEIFKTMLMDKIVSIDFKQAVEDVSPFIYSEMKRTDLKQWNAAFFLTFARNLRESESPEYESIVTVYDESTPRKDGDTMRGREDGTDKSRRVCSVCGVIIRKGSKTRAWENSASFCSKHRPKTFPT